MFPQEPNQDEEYLCITDHQGTNCKEPSRFSISWMGAERARAVVTAILKPGRAG